jgi:myo-inositol-1(or 4)-monophosphatase
MKDIDIMLDAASLAARHAVSWFARSPDIHHKPDGTEVSEADIFVDTFLREHLSKARPGYGWLSEETADNLDRLTKTRTWIVDPIDGTQAFLRGRDDWAICIALVENTQPIAAVVVNPLRKETFRAELGKGALLNNQRLRISNNQKIDNSTIIISQRLLRHQSTQSLRINTGPWANSVAYRLCTVATGKADATMAMSQKQDWDLAAAALLINEAGGVITDYDGSRLQFNKKTTTHRGLIAAGLQLHEHIIREITK